MTEGEARKVLVDALQQTTGALDRSAVSARLRDPVADVAMAELGLDSLDFVEWSVAVEERCGISVDTADFAAATNLSDLVRALMRRVAA